jgi:hypothetical protein
MSSINWHRLFGLTLMDFFTASNYEVELEKELSQKKQYLDVVIIRKGLGKSLHTVPDGLENLREHNLLTYKSLQEPLDEWAVEELIGHYSNYRKLLSPPGDELVPTEQFQLYAISTRYPSKLLQPPLISQQSQPGVIDLRWGKRIIRLIVLSRIPLTKNNAFWLLFSGQKQRFVYGEQHYHWQQPSERVVLKQLYQLYQHKGVSMPYTMTDFERDFTREHLYLLPAEELLKGLSAEERLKGLPAEELLKGLPAEELLKGLPAEERLKGLPAEERLKGLPAEERLKGLPAEERLKGLPAEERLKGLPAEELLKGLPAEERLKGLPAEERLKGLPLETLEAYLAKKRKPSTKPSKKR